MNVWVSESDLFVCIISDASHVKKKVNSNLLENHSPAWTIDIRDEDLLSLCGLFGCNTDTLLYQ